MVDMHSTGVMILLSFTVDVNINILRIIIIIINICQISG